MKVIAATLAALALSVWVFNVDALPSYKGKVPPTTQIKAFDPTARCKQGFEYPVMLCETLGKDGKVTNKVWCMPQVIGLDAESLSGLKFIPWICTTDEKAFRETMVQALRAQEKLRQQQEKKGGNGQEGFIVPPAPKGKTYYL